MMKHMRLMALCLLLSAAASAVADDDYDTFAARIRDEVWQQDQDIFTRTPLPEQFKDESMVVMASVKNIEITRQKKANMAELLASWRLTNQLTCTELHRSLMYINDETARASCSELDYSTVSISHTLTLKHQMKRVIGVRILKPDGSVRSVNVDDYVTQTEGRSEKDQRQKLAVPDLQVGDVLDFFTYEILSLQEFNPPPYTFLFEQQYPVMYNRIDFTIDPRLSVQYRLLNGAPDFEQGTDENGNHTLHLLVKDMNRTLPSRFYDIMDRVPMILFYCYDRNMKQDATPKSAATPGIQDNPPAEDIQADAWRSYSGLGTLSYLQMTAKHSKELKAAAREAKMRLPDVIERANYLYNATFYYTMVSPGNLIPDLFVYMLGDIFELAGIDFDYGLTTSRSHEPIDQLIDAAHADLLIALKDGQHYYLAPDGIQLPGQIPVSYQGRKAIVSTDAKKKWEKVTSRLVVLPESQAADNTEKHSLSATVDGITLNIHRETTATGTVKMIAQQMVANFEDVLNAYRSHLGIEKELLEDMGKRRMAENAETLRQLRQQSQEAFKEEITFYHSTPPERLIDARVTNYGICRDSAATAYATEYTMEGMVRRAGDNLILNIGQLMDTPTAIEGEARQRDADIDRPWAVRVELLIRVELPQGYTLADEQLQALNARVENECGSFSATASVEEGCLLVRSSRQYLHRTEPLQRWPQLLAIVDAASAYRSQQVVLRKR